VAWNGFLAVFLIGLLGGVHCLGMCGGIVGALSLQTAQGAKWPLHLAYNLGRITTYTLLGAVLGWLGAIGGMLEGVLPVQLTLYVLANLMLVAMGLYFLGQTRWLAPFERAGHRLWRWVQPATRRFLPVRSVAQAFPLGLLWGFLPCGLVYSVLATALLAGDGVRGAGVMLAFGLGTLPNLLAAGLLLRRFRDVAGHPWVRRAAGLLVVAFGLLGLWRAPQLGGMIWQGVVCHP
jgi:sulfite exporter TauE/SafE